MADFVGNDKVVLREGATKRSVLFTFRPSSAADKNDGSIPFGTTIADAAIEVYDSAGAKRDDMVAGQAVSGDGLAVTGKFSYSAAAAKKRCKVIIKLTLSNQDATVDPVRWNELWVE